MNKSENDTKVAEMLEDLENSFPRMEILFKVYATPKFAKLVAEVYKEGIFFAREATKYFCSRAGMLSRQFMERGADLLLRAIQMGRG